MTTAVLEREEVGQQAAGKPDLDQYDFESALDQFESGDGAVAPPPKPQQNIPAEPPAAAPRQEQTPAPADSRPVLPADDPSRRSVPADDVAGGNVVEQEVWPADILADFGLTEQDAKVQFGNPDALSTAARALDIRMRQTGRQHLAALQQPPQQQAPMAYQPPPMARQQQAPPPQRQFQPTQQTPPQRGLPVTEFQMPEGDWDEQTVDLVRRMDEHYRQQLEAAVGAIPMAPMMDAMEILARQQQAQVEQQYWQEFFRAAASLPDEYKEVIGDLKAGPIDPQSPQFRSLMDLESQVKETFAGRMAMGMPRVGFDVLVPRLAAVVFPQQHQKAAERQVREKLTRRQSQFTNRPTSRVGSSSDPTMRAAANAENFFRERGIVPRRGRDDDDGLSPGEF